MSMPYGESLFHLGIGIMAAAAALALLATVLFRASGKRLRAQLDREYGKRRH